ncbi:hypothetical protein CDAR_297771 [Caerostris darwini]|uniref:Uncharacterized protein n=1 Tax=Caerostris darwini TaxID=1538125 RepID=A0AAV4PPF6_9ARAC|nr:hypothetical protein CDAR_297771 [Caerostris darwini]
MDETRAVSAVFFSVGLGLLAQFFYVHDLWSLFHFSFYAFLTAITIKENGGLKFLISGLDNWVAEIITYRNRVLIIENTNKPINTPKANFTITEILMSQGDSNVIIEDDNDEIAAELLPPAEYILNGIFPCCKLVDSNNMNNKPIIYFVTDRPNEYPFRTTVIVFLCCHRLSLLPSSNTASSSTSAAVFFHSVELPSSSISRTFHPSSPIAATSSTSSCNTLCCCHIRLRVTFSTANVFHCCRRLLLLPTSSTEKSSSTANIVFYFVRLSLLPTQHRLLLRATFSAANVFHCCRRLPLLPTSSTEKSSSTASIVFYFVRLSLLPTFSTAVVVFLCCRHLPLKSHLLQPTSPSTVAVTCCPRATSFTDVVFLCCHHHDNFERNTFNHL